MFENFFNKEKPVEWKKDSIEANLKSSSDESAKIDADSERGFRTYSYMLGFTEVDIIGKKILDVGAGITAKFAREVEEKNKGTFIVSVSPDYSIKKHSERTEKSGAKNLVAAVGQELPFADKSFDMVVSLFVLCHVENIKDKIKILSEITRVLRPGGIAYIGPTNNRNVFRDDLEFNAMKNEIEKLGAKFTEEDTGNKIRLTDEHTEKNFYEPLKRIDIEKNKIHVDQFV